jgi:hypothetical protein
MCKALHNEEVDIINGHDGLSYIYIFPNGNHPGTIVAKIGPED